MENILNLLRIIIAGSSGLITGAIAIYNYITYDPFKKSFSVVPLKNLWLLLEKLLVIYC